ncbi:hypothetical protein TrRE_jg8127 [Triparma retinervis]|uniref:Uncharacterized protein n=1 Tax=Triparma retinervis TaxID=2557542 RepID=A0A9W6ZWY5_9STRA|nr:hypothetical protein TrRE_jg8127 [Triparma retinervis]
MIGNQLQEVEQEEVEQEEVEQEEVEQEEVEEEEQEEQEGEEEKAKMMIPTVGSSDSLWVYVTVQTWRRCRSKVSQGSSGLVIH